MPIEGRRIQYRGKWWNKVEYFDTDSYEDLPHPVTQIYGVCFDGEGQLLIGLGPRSRWSLLGGTPEPGETWQQTLARKIHQESGMVVVASWAIGYQILTADDGEQIIQIRAGAIVAPDSDFTPSEAISEIKLITPGRYRRFFNWGQISDHLIDRGLETYPAHL